MQEEPAAVRPMRGAATALLSAEDLDVYAVSELEDRILRLREEIARTEAVATRKRGERFAAEALFALPGSSAG